MISHAKARYVRVSPTKVRPVIDLIRGKPVLDSLAILMHVEKAAKRLVLKVLNAAIENAKKKGLQEEQLFVSKIIADEGPKWKRFRAAAFGRATPLLRRTTHLTIELEVKTK